MTTAMNRRNFLKGAALGIGGVAAMGVAGCSPSSASDTTDNASEGSASTETEAEATTTSTWRDAPEAITDISETIDADIVVVGAGASGTVATLAAVEAGANVICIQKGDMVLTHGRNYGAINSRFQQEAGIEDIDLNDITNAHLTYNGYRPKAEFVKMIFSESAETLEWLYDEVGIEYTVGSKSSGNTYDWEWPSFQTGHLTPADTMAIGFSQAIMEKAVELGATVYYNSPGEQLVTDEDGRVTGVIANQDGTYVQFNASKGVILATGDYGSDYEMCADLCPWAVGTNNYYSPNYNTGDGHKMGTWVGGKMESAPHTKMAHVHNCIDGTNLADAPTKKDPFLWVNQNGERFMNEESFYGRICNAVCEQPDDVFYLVFDSDYNTFMETKWNPGSALDEADLETAIENGYAATADTLAELAAAFDIPEDALEATVERYNELCEAGYDEDYGKPVEDMQPVQNAPFWIIRSYTPMDVTMGGLMTDLNMQVLNEDDEVIGGLYAVGNTSGGFFGGQDYDLECDAFSLGRAATTGRIAAQHAAAN